MEFEFDIDDAFPNRVTVLNPPILKHLIKRDSGLKEKYRTVIDKLGRSSAEAQSLPAVITLFNKFLIADASCHLFVLRKGEARRLSDGEGEEEEGQAHCDEKEASVGTDSQGVNDGDDSRDGSANKSAPVNRGTILGFLKVGHRDLFLHNETEELVKVKPLCVLDFYVSVNCQRQGCGITLFDFMLDFLNKEGGFGSPCGDRLLEARHLAYDRPSNKLLPFLKKHFNLSQAVPQFNQFFISFGFFDSDNPCWGNNNNGGKDSRINNRPMPQSRSGGGFFPYSGRSGGGSGDASTAGAAKSPMRRRWFSEDSVTESQSWSSPDKNRPKSEISPSGSEQSDILRGFENVSLGSSEDNLGRYSRHVNKPNFMQSSPQQPHQQTLSQPTQQPRQEHQQQSTQQPRQERQQQSTQSPKQRNASGPATSASFQRSLSLNFEANSEESNANNSANLTTSRSSTREWTSPIRTRDWTSTPRIPIGSEISNPRDRVPADEREPRSSSTISDAFIWMPSSSPVNHRVRAPYATTSPKAESRTLPSSAASIAASDAVSASTFDNLTSQGNKRFQRTSLW